MHHQMARVGLATGSWAPRPALTRHTNTRAQVVSGCWCMGKYQVPLQFLQENSNATLRTRPGRTNNHKPHFYFISFYFKQLVQATSKMRFDSRQ